MNVAISVTSGHQAMAGNLNTLQQHYFCQSCHCSPCQCASRTYYYISQPPYPRENCAGDVHVFHCERCKTCRCGKARLEE
jgi:hypothetical protein